MAANRRGLTRNRLKKRITGLSIALAFAVLPVITHAGTAKDFFQNGAMQTSTNYNPSGAPTNTVDVRITSSTAAETITATTLTLESLSIDNGSTHTIGNATGVATNSTLNIGNSAGFTNVFSTLANDLIYLTGNSTLTIQGPNSGSGTGILNVTLQSSGNFNIGTGSTLTSTAVMSGAGISVTKTSGGTLNLSGANTFSGTFTASGGTTNLTVNNALQNVTAVSVASGATVKTSVTGLTNAINDNAAVTDNGTLNVSGGTETVASLAGTNTAALVTIGKSGANNGGFTVGDANNTSFAGVIQDGTAGAGTTTFTKQGAGTLTLSNTNTYTGTTNINAGTLNVTGSLGNTNVVITNANSTLSSGAASSIGGSVTANSGTFITPGGAGTVGTLTLGGLTMNNGSTINFDFASSASFDQILLGGNSLTLGAGTETINVAGTTFSAGTFDLLTYTGKTGTAFTLGTVTGGNSGSFTFALNTLTNATQLVITAVATGANIWDDNGATAGSGGTGGNWSEAKWTADTTGSTATTTFTDGTTATFAAGTNATGTYTVNVDTTVNTLGLSFEEGDVTLAHATGGSLTLTGAAVNVASGATGTISEDIHGTVGLGKSGVGKLTLSGNNDYTGTTTISTGVVNIQSANALGATGGGNGTSVTAGAALEIQGGITTAAEALTLNGTGISSGGALRNVSGDNTYAGAITLGGASRINSDSGTLTLNSGGTAITGTGNALTFGGAGNVTVSDGINTGAGGSVTKDGTGTLLLAGASNYTGATTISQGVLRASNSTSLGTVAGGVSVANGAALELVGNISIGAEAITLNGTGVSNGSALRNVSDANTYGGAVTLGSASRITSDAGILTMNSGTAWVGGNNAITFGGAGNTSVSSVLNTTVASLTKDGSGTLGLSGANTYVGGTNIQNGAVQLSGGNDRLATTGSVVLGDVSTSGKLILGDTSGASNQTVAGLTTTGNGGSVVGGNASNSTLTTNIATTNTFSGTLGGAGANENNLALTKTGAGELALTGNNTYTGPTAVNGGTVRAGSNTALGASTVTVSGSNLYANAGINVANNITLASAAGAPLLLAGWDFQTTGTGGTAASAAPGSPLVYNANFGNGTIYLNGTNGSSTWTSLSSNPEVTAFAGTAVNAGPGFSTTTTSPAALALANSSANGKMVVFSINMTSLANLSISYATQGTATGFTSQVWEYSTNGTTWSALDSVTSVPGTFGAETLATTSGLDNSATAFVRLTLTGATAASGNNRFDNIQFNTPGAPVAAVIGSDITSGTATFSGTVSLNSDASVTSAAGGTVDFTGVIQNGANGAKGISKIGAGIVNLSGANTYGGDTTVSTGTLQLGAANVVPDGSGKGNVSVAASATLDMNGFSETINGLSGARHGRYTLGRHSHTQRRR